jgi:hypothetical protein
MIGFGLRWGFAFLLLTATYNPTSWNFVRWVSENGANPLSLVVLSGLVLLIGYIIYLRATLRSIGAVGMVLVLGVIAALLWVAFDFEWLDFSNPTANTWIGLFALSIVLGIGLSWSHVRRRLSGQADMDDVDE